jgi:glutathione S-transferase
MLKIFGKSSSINVRKVLWTCAEIGIPYELEQWGSGVKDTHTSYFLQLNPNGMVPVIEDEGATLWESNSICRYLASKHRRIDLLPENPIERAQVEKWMDWQLSDLNNSWRYAFMALVRSSPGHTDQAAIAHSEMEWNKFMGILNSQLASTNAFVAGSAFTLADIVLGLSVNRWMETPINRPDLPALNRYFARLCERAGFIHHGKNGLP